MQTHITKLRTLSIWIAAAFFGVLLACPAQALDAEIKQLHKEVEALIKQGNHKQADVIATQLLALTEKSLGQDHPALP